MKKWDIILVDWMDSSGSAHWQNINEVLHDDYSCTCRTVGFFLGYNKYCIRVAASFATSDQVNHVMYIPKVAIKKVKVIKKAQEK